ncbi:hypothetical protein PAPYR_8615 [Paratrimastix pyriformis]|uniref:Uncharacterized protein n=1 Tax=Paratrimastix pyriformis TaxID=342808 RepID=A0ABQ8UCS0_9EUKA|nr:hypothetical protein PAPYR_8615 [Paratrimastix pyriformis]
MERKKPPNAISITQSHRLSAPGPGPGASLRHPVADSVDEMPSSRFRSTAAAAENASPCDDGELDRATHLGQRTCIRAWDCPASNVDENEDAVARDPNAADG